MDQNQSNALSKISSFEDLFSQAENHPDYWVEGAILEFTDEVLRKLKASGLSRSDLAEKLGHSPPQISRLLSGRNNFTLRTMVEVSRALNCELRLHLQSAGMRTAWVEYSAAPRRIKLASPVTLDLGFDQAFSPCPRLLNNVQESNLRTVTVSINETVSSPA
jgi:transcriptional regulator with XRE-family HTH domain